MEDLFSIITLSSRQRRKVLTRYYIWTPHTEDEKPVFASGMGWHLTKPQVLYSSIITTPLVTERLNLITHWAERQLDNMLDRICYHIDHHQP